MKRRRIEFRISEEEYELAIELARLRGTNLSSLWRELLRAESKKLTEIAEQA